MDTSWKLGFVARNGRGKTTFLNLLMGKYEYVGSISAAETFDYFPFSVEDTSQDTIQIVEQIYPDYEQWKIVRELSLLNLEEEILYRSFSTLSKGEQTKVMLAVLFSRENNFPLIDEPANHLDMPARDTVRDYLKDKSGFLLVSHDRDFLDQCIDHVLVINKTDIQVYQGNFSTWWENKQRQDAFELAENEKLKKEIGRLQKAAKQAEDWADKVESTKIGKGSGKYEKNIDTRAYVGEKSRRMQRRRKNLERRREEAIEEKSGLLKNLETAEDLKLFPLSHHKEVLVRLEETEVSYPSKTLPKVNLEIRGRDRVFLQGPNGCGKSSVIKVLLQKQMESQDGSESRKESREKGRETGWEEAEIVEYTGKVELASGLVISYVSQDTGSLRGTLTEYAEERGLDKTLFLALLRKLDFSRVQFEKRMEDYSSGQKKKVLIAASLCQPAHLYIWDEPLNYLDVFSRMQIENLILEMKPTMLLVEHDRTFVDKLATKVIEYKEKK